MSFIVNSTQPPPPPPEQQPPLLPPEQPQIDQELLKQITPEMIEQYRQFVNNSQPQTPPPQPTQDMQQVNQLISSLSNQLNTEKKRSNDLNNLIASLQSDRSPDQIAFTTLTAQLKSQQSLIEKLVNMIVEMKIDGGEGGQAIEKVVNLLPSILGGNK